MPIILSQWAEIALYVALEIALLLPRHFIFLDVTFNICTPYSRYQDRPFAALNDLSPTDTLFGLSKDSQREILVLSKFERENYSCQLLLKSRYTVIWRTKKNTKKKGKISQRLWNKNIWSNVNSACLVYVEFSRRVSLSLFAPIFSYISKKKGREISSEHFAFDVNLRETWQTQEAATLREDRRRWSSARGVALPCVAVFKPRRSTDASRGSLLPGRATRFERAAVTSAPVTGGNWASRAEPRRSCGPRDIPAAAALRISRRRGVFCCDSRARRRSVRTRT